MKKTERYLSSKGIKKGREIPKNSVLVTCIGATIGKMCILPENGSCNQQLNAIIPYSKFDSDFIYYTIQKNTEKLRLYAGNTATPILNKKSFGNLDYNFPCYDEQKRISSFISKIDEKIELLEKTQKKLEKLNFKLISEIMEQNYIIPNHNNVWRKISLNNIGNSYAGLTGKNKDDFNKGNSKFIPYSSIFNDIILDSSNFENVIINESENQNLVSKGDIFFTGSSETPNEVGMASVLLQDLDNCYLNSFCFGFRLKSFDKYNPLFLVYYFRSLKFKKELFKLAQGSTRFNISKKELLKKEIEIPSKVEQDYYVKLIYNLFSKTKHISNELSYMKNFKKGLLQKMFV